MTTQFPELNGTLREMAFRMVTRVLSAPPRSYLGAYCRVSHLTKGSKYSTTSEDDVPVEESVQQHAQEPRYTCLFECFSDQLIELFTYCSELYRGMSAAAFTPEIVSKLEAPLNPADVEIKLDGELYGSVPFC